jgi:predicted alternative tryptophan synthase beta-subunit
MAILVSIVVISMVIVFIRITVKRRVILAELKFYQRVIGRPALNQITVIGHKARMIIACIAGHIGSCYANACIS